MAGRDNPRLFGMREYHSMFRRDALRGDREQQRTYRVYFASAGLAPVPPPFLCAPRPRAPVAMGAFFVSRRGASDAARGAPFPKANRSRQNQGANG